VDNLIEDNTVVGNSNGIFVAAGVKGNTFRRNLIVGNPPLQVAVDHSPSTGVDIKNAADDGANTFTGNVCMSSVNAPCPAIAPANRSKLAGELQYLGCGTYPPAASCQLAVSQWNVYLSQVDPNALPLVVDDSTQQMTALQYVQARSSAGL